jgi:hypothetical protein
VKGMSNEGYMASDVYDVCFGPSDPKNPDFGYFIKITRNGKQILYTGRHPVNDLPLTYAACLEVASFYGPAVKT